MRHPGGLGVYRDCRYFWHRRIAFSARRPRAPRAKPRHVALYTISLCSGIGGLELGIASVVPIRTVCYVESEAYAAATLVARMEEGRLHPAPVWNDIRTFDGRPWRGVVDIVTAGYPCQIGRA